MVVIVAIGTPVAVYVSRCSPREHLVWQACLLLSVLLPPLSLGILFSLAFGPDGSGCPCRGGLFGEGFLGGLGSEMM